MYRRVRAALLSMLIVLGVLVGTTGTAQASVGRVWVTCDSWSGIYMHGSAMGYQTIQPCGTVQPGTTSALSIYIGPGWCITYFWDPASGARGYAGGGSTGGWFSFTGGSNVRTLWTESWYGSWCPTTGSARWF